MVVSRTDIEFLRTILANIHNPGALNEHPWVVRPFVRDVVSRHRELEKEMPGRQLIYAVCELFWKMLPGSPPRRGKRLDTRWAEFGILAAQYFAPLQFGTPVPKNLREAWGRMDQAILLYVNENDPNIHKANASQYRLTSNEPSIAPDSTLSDWHRKGIERLADVISAHEQYLTNPMQGALSAQPKSKIVKAVINTHLFQVRRIFSTLLLLLVSVVLILGAIKIEKIYRMMITIRNDLQPLRSLASSRLSLEVVRDIRSRLDKLDNDFDAFQKEAEPLFWFEEGFWWVPTYGRDLASSSELISIADSLLESAKISFSALDPLIVRLNQTAPAPTPPEIIDILREARPGLLQAQRVLNQAKEIRNTLSVDHLSPRAQSLVIELDEITSLMDDGLTIALGLPGFLGATNTGPKTYLLLAQNEDELRPTGGLITAASTLVVQNGQVVSLNFVDSGELDNWEKPYPAAPWQLGQYMNTPLLVLRDASWFTDYPTAAWYAETLYAYKSAHSVDGVIAFDQQALITILKAIGPIEVDSAPFLIDANNVVTFMRSAKSPPAGQVLPAGWTQKGFMNQIAKAIIEKTFDAKNNSWESIGRALITSLEERHLLVYLDDKALADVAERHGWDGALRPPVGDFLMVVDANVGFNKANAVVETEVIYRVDLTDPSRPTSRLTVIHHNNAPAKIPCVQWGGPRLDGEEHYPMNACYWNYMRVYTPTGVQMLDATPQSVPAEWTIIERDMEGRVDVLDEELQGLQVFGTFMVVPAGESLVTTFSFALPTGVLEMQPNSKHAVYRLMIKKQPGTLAIPVTVQIRIPSEWVVRAAPSNVVADDGSITFQSQLRTDVNIRVEYERK